MENHGVVFHLVLGNELFSYPWPVEFVKALKPFWGRYAIYSTFPPGWTGKYLDDCISAGIYNLSCGVDVWPGLKTGDKHVDRKSSAGMYWLEYCIKKGVPDVQANITIHRQNYDKLDPLLDLCTEKGMHIGLSMIEASSDGKHDFYGGVESMKEWLIPEDERSKFRDEMYRLATEVRTGRWKVQNPPSQFEALGDREMSQTTWHCSLPLLINIEEDGALRACGYRGPLKEKHSVFELGDGRLSMEEYVRLQQQCTSECPGCGTGGGAWTYWDMSERFYRGALEVGDEVFKVHHPGWDFEEASKRKS